MSEEKVHLSVETSEQDFTAFTRGFIQQSNVDPNSLQESIDNYSDRFDRLKFLFLEQEAKEQFLRLVLEQNIKHVDRDVILTSVAQGEELKLILEEKKKKIDELDVSIEQLSREIHELANETKLKLEKINSLNEDIANESSKLADIKKELAIEDSNNPEIQKFQELQIKYNNLQGKYPQLRIDSKEVLDLSKEQILTSLREMKESKGKALSKIYLLEQLKSEQIIKNKTNKEMLEIYLERNKKLDETIEQIKNSNFNENDEMIAKKKKLLLNESKLKILHQLWLKISKISSFKFEDSKIFLNYKKFPNDQCIIVLDKKNGSIESISYSLVKQSVLNDIIISSNKDKNPLFKASEQIYNNI